jgi:hypothetical protein
MDRSKSRIDPEDTVVLFADLQLGIAELSKTMPIDRLKKGNAGTNLPFCLDNAFDELASEAHMHSEVITGPGRFFAPNEKVSGAKSIDRHRGETPRFHGTEEENQHADRSGSRLYDHAGACLSISSRGAPASKSCPRTRTVCRGVAGRRRKLAANRMRTIVKKSDT